MNEGGVWGWGKDPEPREEVFSSKSSPLAPEGRKPPSFI